MLVTSRRRFLFGMAAAALAASLPKLAEPNDVLVLSHWDKGFGDYTAVIIVHPDGREELAHVISWDAPTLTVRRDTLPG